jgi:hypothetical protein
MKLSFVQPRAELQPYIESFWIFESAIGMPAADRSMAAPNGCAKLIIPYENSLTSIADGRVQVSREQGLYFVGNRDTSTLIHSSARRTGFIVIEFKPFGAYPIFGIPMHETTNRLLDSDEDESVCTCAKSNYLKRASQSHGVNPLNETVVSRFTHCGIDVPWTILRLPQSYRGYRIESSGLNPPRFATSAEVIASYSKVNMRCLTAVEIAMSSRLRAAIYRG